MTAPPDQAETRRVFIASRDDKDEAYALARIAARTLVAADQVPQKLIDVTWNPQLGWIVELVEEIIPQQRRD